VKNTIDYKIFEYKSSLSDDELLEMANITSNETGIDDVVIWIGPSPSMHGHKIKVSNIPNKISSDNLFTITIPDFNIIGDINSKFINDSKLNKIKEFLTINNESIIEYSEYKLSTKEFLDKLIKV
jgi:hypothetical protein